MKEQIEEIYEIAWDLCDIPKHPDIKSCEECKGGACHAKYYAERAYHKGYRKQEWISVEDRLPEEREHVIVFCEDGLVGEAWHKKEGLFWWMDERDGIAAVTHWMPLPEPPKMKGGAE